MYFMWEMAWLFLYLFPMLVVENLGDCWRHGKRVVLVGYWFMCCGCPWYYMDSLIWDVVSGLVIDLTLSFAIGASWYICVKYCSWGLWLQVTNWICWWFEIGWRFWSLVCVHVCHMRDDMVIPLSLSYVGCGELGRVLETCYESYSCKILVYVLWMSLILHEFTSMRSCKRIDYIFDIIFVSGIFLVYMW